MKSTLKKHRIVLVFTAFLTLLTTAKVFALNGYNTITVDSYSDSSAFMVNGSYTSIALNSSGNPVISYSDADNGDLKVAFCNDTNCTSPTIANIDSTGYVGLFASLILNDDDYPIISYHDSSNGALKVAICNDATCTLPTLTTIDNSVQWAGYYTSIALSNSGNAVISYFNGNVGDLKLAVCNDATCTSPTITTIDSIGWVGWDTSIALNINGNPVISY